MSQLQKNAEGAADQGQTCEKTDSQIAAVCMDVEEPCTSSHLMASSLKGQTREQTQSQEVSAESSEMEETCTSSHHLMAGSLKGQTCEGTQGLQVATVSSDVEEPCSSSQLMSSSRKGQTCQESQGLEIPQVSMDVEEPYASSHSLMASSQNDPADETPNTSRGNQEEQGYPVNPPCQQGAMNVPVMGVDSKVNFLVNYMLYKYQMKEVMSKNDILRLIVREDENRFHEILMRSAERMEMVFGLEVKEVDPVNHVYGLFIKLGLTYDGMRSDVYSFPKTGLLILILGIVFMKGNRATEEEIWELLSPMGICAGMNHLIFGDPRQLITDEFVKEQYLVYQPVPNTDPVRYVYVWGPRARAETTKMKVLEFVAKIHRTHPNTFQSQYEEALIEEEEKILAMILSRIGPISRSGARSGAVSRRYPRI